MRSVARRACARLLAALVCAGLLLAAVTAAAQYDAARHDRPALDAMLAPIALYPDALLAHVLMAATYPDEIQEAAAWLRARPGLSGDAAVRTSLDHDWEPSVRSLLAFPMVLETLASHPRWTADLGAAFLMQRAEVMETIQSLRRRAYEAGTLQSNDAVQVNVTLSGIVIEQVAAETVHVPHYDPQVVYGGWWWPSHPPVHWPRWPSYVDPLGHSLAWGPGIHVASGFFFGGFVWPRHEVRVVHVRPYYYPRRFVERHVVPGRGHVVVHREARPGVWRHHDWRRHRDGRSHDRRYGRDDRHDWRHDPRRDVRPDHDRRGPALTRRDTEPREGRPDWRRGTHERDHDGRADWDRRGDRDGDGHSDWRRGTHERDRDGRGDWNRRSDGGSDARRDWSSRSDRDGEARRERDRGTFQRDRESRPDRHFGTERGERRGPDAWRGQRPDRDEGRARVPREAPRARERPERGASFERRAPSAHATPREARPMPRARIDPGNRE